MSHFLELHQLLEIGPIMAGSETHNLLILYKDRELHAYQGNSMGRYKFMTWWPYPADRGPLLPTIQAYAEDFIELLEFEFKDHDQPNYPEEE